MNQNDKIESGVKLGFEAIYTVDGVARLVSYRRIDGYPLVVGVAHGLDDVLADWRRANVLHGIVDTATILVIAMIGARFAGQIKWTLKAERGYRLLADNSSDITGFIGLNGARLYLSSSFTTLTGWSVRDGLELPWQSFVHTDDMQSMAGLYLRLRAGAGPLTHNLCYACQDGKYRWTEVHVRLANETVSIGVTTMARVPDDAGDRSRGVVAEADAALYAAKYAGRNRVRSHATIGVSTAVPEATPPT